MFLGVQEPGRASFKAHLGETRCSTVPGRHWKPPDRRLGWHRAVPLLGAACVSQAVARTTVTRRRMAGSSDPVFIGVDFGTSGCRAACLNDAGEVVSESSVPYGDDAGPKEWQSALHDVVTQLGPCRDSAAAICIDGTSATVMLCHKTHGAVLAGPLMYNFSCEADAVQRCRATIPNAEHTAAAPTSTLCKAWQFMLHSNVSMEESRLVHQADWLLAQLLDEDMASPGTDYHNALKLGYDVEALEWPKWLVDSQVGPLLPEAVFTPGETIGFVGAKPAKRFGLPTTCRVAAGTTDSIAAFLAADTKEVGEAVTSLGSTMAVKLRSLVRVDDAAFGVYSHRLGGDPVQWLVGGASNTGGVVLRKFFTDKVLKQLSTEIDPEKDSGLDYYPLPSRGQRFPVCDENLEPRLEPRPSEDALFLHGILEGMARIEASGYQKLEALGAATLTRVVTAGGGAQNPVWRRIRERLIGVKVESASRTEACCGTALLAMRGTKLLGGGPL